MATAKLDKEVNSTVTRYPVSALISSKALKKYHKAFIKAILKDGEYTVKEAVAKIDTYMKKEVK